MRNWSTPAALVVLAGALVSCEGSDIAAPEAQRTSTSEVCKAVFDSHEPTSRVFLDDDLDPGQGEFPEGIAVDHRGNVYLGLRPTGEVLRFRPGTGPEVVTQFDAEDPDGNRLGDQGLLGLGTDRQGNVYAAVAVSAFNPEAGAQATTHGVWRISPEGDRELVPGTEEIFLPNAVTFDSRGNLYVTSSSGPPSGEDGFAEGAIWKVQPGGSAELWLRDPELTGAGLLTPPIGANGIAHHGGSVFVANSTKGQIVEVPIRPDGSPGATRVVKDFPGPTPEDPITGSLDGLAVDACGNLYPLLVLESRLVRVSPDGEKVETLAAREDGLQSPTSLAFGTGENARSVFIAENAAIAAGFGLVETPEPKVVQVDVGVPGPEAR